MLDNKTSKYRIPESGVYCYVTEKEGKTEMIVLNGTDSEQTVDSNHFNKLTNNRKEGTMAANGKKVDFTQNLVLSARQSLVIEF